MRGDRNEEIRQNQPFCTYLTFALPDRTTDRPTDGQDLLQKCEDALKKKLPAGRGRNSKEKKNAKTKQNKNSTVDCSK